jgi:hypothetical protein
MYRLTRKTKAALLSRQLYITYIIEHCLKPRWDTKTIGDGLAFLTYELVQEA